MVMARAGKTIISAIGVRMPTWASFSFSLMEFDTLKRHKLPAIAIIGNDACWSQIARDQVPWFDSAVSNNYSADRLKTSETSPDLRFRLDAN